MLAGKLSHDRCQSPSKVVLKKGKLGCRRPRKEGNRARPMYLSASVIFYTPEQPHNTTVCGASCSAIGYC